MATLNELHEQGKLIGRKVRRETSLINSWVVFEHRLSNEYLAGVDKNGSPFIAFGDDAEWHLVEEPKKARRRQFYSFGAECEYAWVLPKPRLYIWEYKNSLESQAWRLDNTWRTKEQAKQFYAHWTAYRISAVCPEGIEDEEV